jgi:hypothetical protein
MTPLRMLACRDEGRALHTQGAGAVRRGGQHGIRVLDCAGEVTALERDQGETMASWVSRDASRCQPLLAKATTCDLQGGRITSGSQ